MPVGVDMGKGNWNLLGSSGVQWENSEHAQKISSGIQRSRKDFTITSPNPEVWFLFILFSFVTWNQIPFHPSGCRRPTKALLATWLLAPKIATKRNHVTSHQAIANTWFWYNDFTWDRLHNMHDVYFPETFWALRQPGNDMGEPCCQHLDTIACLTRVKLQVVGS